MMAATSELLTGGKGFCPYVSPAAILYGNITSTDRVAPEK